MAGKTRQRLKKSVTKKTSAGSRRGASSSRSAARGARQTQAGSQGEPTRSTPRNDLQEDCPPSRRSSRSRHRGGGAASGRRRRRSVTGSRSTSTSCIPAHGVGQILAIEEQEVAGYKLELFVINFIKDKMTLRVPVTKIATVGMRKLAEGGLVKRALETLKGRARIKRTMWSRRAQEYEAKINSGDIVAIAEVVRDLYPLRHAAGAELFRAPALRSGSRPALARNLGGAALHRDRGDQGDRGGARQGPAPRSEARRRGRRGSGRGRGGVTLLLDQRENTKGPVARPGLLVFTGRSYDTNMAPKTRTIELDEGLADVLQARAAERGVSVSSLLTELVNSEAASLTVNSGEIFELDRRWAAIEAGEATVANADVVRWLETWGTPAFKPWQAR